MQTLESPPRLGGGEGMSGHVGFGIGVQVIACGIRCQKPP
jgi:hypothetical protein